MVPANEQGLGCDRSVPGCAVPTNVQATLTFDRPLLPSTAVRQSISIFVNDKAAYMPLYEPEYDVLTRRVTFRTSSTLLPGVLYQMRLPVPKGDSGSGFRAFDGAPLEDGPVRTKSAFFTADGPAERPPSAPFAEPTCSQVIELFNQSCVSGCCHGKDDPAMGLALDSADSVTNSAVLRVAHQTETGNTLGVSFPNPVRFGVSMRRIEPRSSFSSYLVYKLLLNPENAESCSSGSPFCALPGANDCVPLSDAERQQLAEWFVQGEAMPPTPRAARLLGCDDQPPREHLDCGDLRAITRWIDRGAVCP